MKAFYGVLKLLIFLIAFTFAIKNTKAVTLRYYLGTQWQAPLILVILAAFGAGVVAGVIANLARIGRLRRELAVARRKAAVVNVTEESAVPTRIADAL